MTNEPETLEPCPFCGGKATTRQGKNNPSLWFVDCKNMCMDFIGQSEEDVVRKWNTRYKRTCHQTNTGDCIKCSECGNFTTTRTVSKRFMPRFCGSCGAEVVDG